MLRVDSSLIPAGLDLAVAVAVTVARQRIGDKTDTYRGDEQLILG